MSDIEIFAAVIFATVFAGFAFFRYVEYRNLCSGRWTALSRMEYERPRMAVQVIFLVCCIIAGVAQIVSGSVVFGILWILAGAIQCWEQIYRYDRRYRLVLTPYRIIFTGGASWWRYKGVKEVVYSADRREVVFFSQGNLRAPVPMDEADFATMKELLRRYAPNVFVAER